ncbi:MAG: cyclic-di-AMP receptor [Deinococcus sp.]|nr:cyclic-di-AMP receptor [Deinococcus sp.]
MKLLIVVVQSQDAAGVLSALAEERFEATRLASTGGFLREGNTTLLIGVDDRQVDRVKQVVSQHCQRRERPLPPGRGESLRSKGVLVSGAVMFVLKVDEFAKY